MEETMESKCKMKNRNRRTRKRELAEQDLDGGVTIIPDYIIKDRLRYVEKYTYVFRTFVKGRWVGRKLIEVLVSEFKANDEPYYLQAIEDKRILVNNQAISPDYEICLPDQITHFTERIEVPIIEHPIEFIEENDDYLILNKPSSMPVHPCGNYKYNTLQLILEREHGYNQLRICNRLDKQTSGIVFCAKSMESANEFSSDLKKFGEIKKAYYARVVGKIDISNPDSLFINDPNDANSFIVDKPIFKIKSSYCDTKSDNPNSKGKDAKTRFQIMFYDEQSNTTVVNCFPFTGRTHQIRVHLKSIGHPIANDIKYGGTLFNDIPGFIDNSEQLVIDDEEEKDITYDQDEIDSILFTPKMIEGMCLQFWLHAYKYVFKDKEYVTSVPEWAKEDYKIEKVFELKD